jgi:diphosphomevalonate decarboxylase
VPTGFVEWQIGEDHDSSYAFSIAPPEHWDLVDCIAILSQEHKTVGSFDGHTLANTSPLQAARVEDAPLRLDICRRAILERDFEALAQVTELDSNLMHAVIMTSTQPLMYWEPATITIMHAVTNWRKEGLPACYTIDAGPNVHVICLSSYAETVVERLSQIPDVIEVLKATPGGPARCIGDEFTFESG